MGIFEDFVFDNRKGLKTGGLVLAFTRGNGADRNHLPLGHAHLRFRADPSISCWHRSRSGGRIITFHRYVIGAVILFDYWRFLLAKCRNANPHCDSCLGGGPDRGHHHVLRRCWWRNLASACSPGRAGDPGLYLHQRAGENVELRLAANEQVIDVGDANLSCSSSIKWRRCSIVFAGTDHMIVSTLISMRRIFTVTSPYTRRAKWRRVACGRERTDCPLSISGAGLTLFPAPVRAILRPTDQGGA